MLACIITCGLPIRRVEEREGLPHLNSRKEDGVAADREIGVFAK
jgi:hypothetical protein